MKRILGISLFLFASIFMLARTPQEAANIASLFINQSHIAPAPRLQRAAASTTITTPVELVYTQYQTNSTTPAVFIFNNLQAEGFVLVSAEDNARAILGYSDKGTFDQTNIPENMQFWLTMYANELARAATTTSQSQQRVGGKINDPLPDIEPILGETVWGQGEPFNNLCPIVNGKRSVAGCVATAVSQIMYAHKYPTKGTGSNSYSMGKDIQISEDFSQTTYDWEHMIPNYNKQYTAQEANAVATLVYHTGVASFMSYNPNGSGAVSEWALQAMNKHFGYDAEIKPLLKDYLLEYDILTAVAADLEKGQPIYVSGSTTNNEGHAFVCDGIHSDGYVHINWGWNGSGNGFYVLSALDPGEHGVGGSSENLAFTEDVALYTNIRPDQGGKAQPCLYAKAQQEHKNRIARNEKVTFKLEGLGNAGTGDMNGNLGFYIYDSKQNLVDKASLYSIKLRPGYQYSYLTLSSTIASKLANGTYALVMGSLDESNNLHPLLVYGQGYPRYTFTLTNDSIFFENTDIKQPTTMQVDWINKAGSNQWQMDLYSPSFWSESAAKDEWLIRCTFTSNSNTSIIGTYILNKNSNTAGNINLGGAVCAIGNASNCKQHTLSDMQLTVTQADATSIAIQYTIEFNGQRYTGNIIKPQTKWYQEQNGSYSDYTAAVTYQVATPLTTTQAIAQSKTYTPPLQAPIDYLIAGTIVEILDTPEEIVAQQYVNLNISEDGDNSKMLSCYNATWYNGTAWNTGEELHASDQVVLLGKPTYENKTPILQADLYQHTPTTYLPITSFDFQIDGMKMTATWQSDAPYYKIRLYTEDGKTVANNTIAKKTITATLPTEGKYTFYVRPMQKDKKHFAGAAESITFIASTSTNTEIITENAKYEVYDLMGNKVGIVNGEDNYELQSLQQGVYILVGKNAKKIFIP